MMNVSAEPRSLAELYKNEVLEDYSTCVISREASYAARKEVLTGKAKFGIVGDGKEVPQVAMARAFKNGDFRSGYYRDQTFMFALGLSTLEDFFAQLYADAENDPFSGGRQMNSHFATPLIDSEDNWTEHKNLLNVSSDISCTAGQMARAVGLALASKKYRENPALANTAFSDNGNEVCFVTIGDASTSEGIFWESMNAAGVMQIPLLVSVWDDGYGISVPVEYQTIKGSISEVLRGFQIEEGTNGIDIYRVKAWDYPALCEVYERVAQACRLEHRPALIHVQECTQPQGHSTSGSHERYKTPERLAREKELDCNTIMRKWILDNGIATEEELLEIESDAKNKVKEAKLNAWSNYTSPIKENIRDILAIFEKVLAENGDNDRIVSLISSFKSHRDPLFKDIVKAVRKLLMLLSDSSATPALQLKEWYDNALKIGAERYHTHLHCDNEKSALRVPIVPAEFGESPTKKNGYEVLNHFFDKKLEDYPNLYAFGEDVGQIGDVNQGFAGLQEKHGRARVFDTGIREWTIMGQAIGMAMRGLRPIAEIQYLDYLIYGLTPLSDDLATLRYRSNGMQAAPAIIRTRGHRLEGIWHAGSPIGMMLNALRGIYILTPRNMTQAAGMYNTMLQSNDPAIIIECLNGYRLKENLPTNLDEFTVPLGMPEVLKTGSDITLVTYGSCIREAMQGIKLLEEEGISVELIDAQTILPFDLDGVILESLKKTNRILFMDEDVPGGATAYMMQQVLEVHGGYRYLDAAPATLTAKAHRPPYGSDGDYFSKPNAEDVFETVYKMVYEAHPDYLNKMHFLD